MPLHKLRPVPKLMSFRTASAVRNLLSNGVAMARERCYYVYIMASRSRVLYVGVTGFLMARVLRHKAGEGGAFTRKYRVHRLVYYHSFQNVGDAIARDRDQEMAAGKEGGFDSRGQSDLGRFGCGMVFAASVEPEKKSA